MFPRLAILAVLSTTPALAESADMLNADCRYAPERVAKINELKGLFGKIIEPVEAVPPAEAEYIRKETAASIFLKNQARFNLVYSNRFYQAVQVRDGVAEVQKYLDRANEYPCMATVALASLIDALSATGELTEAVSTYIDVDGTRGDSVLPKDGIAALSAAMAYARGMTAIVAKCFVASLSAKP